jgi:hypothetical protein
MCFWLPLGQTDRNTCSVSVTNFVFNFIKNKLSYNGFITDFLLFYRFSTNLNMKQRVFWVLLSPS